VRPIPDRRTLLLGVALAAVGLAAIMATRALVSAPPAPDAIDARRNPFPPTPASLAAGERVYRAYCQVCHGVDGRGDGPDAAGLFPRPIDFWAHFGSGHTHPDGRLYFWITDGMPGTPMPGFKDKIADADRWHVINFIKTFAPVDR